MCGHVDGEMRSGESRASAAPSRVAASRVAECRRVVVVTLTFVVACGRHTQQIFTMFSAVNHFHTCLKHVLARHTFNKLRPHAV